jgi:hypothetical protein
MTGGTLQDIAQQVVDRELTIGRELCVPASRPERRTGTDQEPAWAEL